MIDGDSYGLNKGLLGFGSDNSRGQFDNVQLRTLPAQLTLDRFENFSDGVADWLAPEPSARGPSRPQPLQRARPAAGLGVSLVDLGQPDRVRRLPRARRHASAPGPAGSASCSTTTTQLDFKYVMIDVVTDRVVLGHRTAARLDRRPVRDVRLNRRSSTTRSA